MKTQHRTIGLLTVGLIVAIASACAPKTGTVEGIVMKAGIPVPNIAVTFEGADVKSDTDNQVVKSGPDGHFTFKELPPGSSLVTMPLDVSGRRCIIMASVTISAGKTEQVNFSESNTIDLSFGPITMDLNGNIISCQ